MGTKPKFKTEQERLEAQAKAKSKWYYKSKSDRAKKKAELIQSFSYAQQAPLMPVGDFFKIVTGYTPLKFQIEILELLVKPEHVPMTFIHCCRGASKTLLASVAVAYIATEYARWLEQEGKPRNFDILIVAGQERLYQLLDGIINNNRELYGFNSINGKYDRLKISGVSSSIPRNSVEIYSSTSKRYVTTLKRVSATSKAVRGNRADWVFLDEAADIDTSVIEACLGIPVGDIARHVLLSTPHANNSFFNNHVADQTKGYVFYNKDSDGIPWLVNTLPLMKAELDAETFAIEACGRLPKRSEERYFNPKNIDRCIRDSEYFDLGSKGQCYVGVDFGKVDSTAYCAITKLPNGKATVTRLVEFNDINRDDVGREIAKLLMVDNPLYVKADYLPKSYQGVIERYSRVKVHYVLGQGKVREIETEDRETAMFANANIPTHYSKMLSELLTATQQQDLIIPIRLDGAQKLVREMKLFRKGVTQHTDNLLSSLLFAYYHYPSNIESCHSTIIVSCMGKGRTYTSSNGSPFISSKGYKIGDEHHKSVKTLW